MTNKLRRDVPCVYCASRAATTRDHVLSKALFPTFPDNMITVRVCEPCNQEKSRDEPLMRDLLVADLYGFEHPAARELFQGKVKRAIATNRSEFAKLARERSFQQPVFDSKGVVIGSHVAVPVEEERVNRVLIKMVRGLLFHLTGERIPQEYAFGAGLIDARKVEETIQEFVLLPHQGPYSWGDGVCECVFMQAGDNPALTLWLLRFYRGKMFLIDTAPEGTY